ncbi:MAG: Lrp/AsnC family transcriptional regulator [Candidatus Woesearchaeota archaeon]
MAKMMEYLFETGKLGVDRIDIKVLDALREDARLPLSELSKKCRISKQTALYRINKLLDKKIIRGFHSNIDYTLLGYNMYYLFLKTRYILDEKKFVEELSHIRGCLIIMKCLSQYNYTLKIITTDIYSTAKELEELFNKNKNITTHFMLQRLERSSKKVEIDAKDKRILQELSINCRLNSLELSRRTGLSYDVVHSRVKALIKNKVIASFITIINFEAEGFMDYSILMKFADDKLEQLPILDSLLRNDQLVVRRFKTVGEFNYMFEVVDKDFLSINDKINKIRSQFHEMIRSSHIVPIQTHYFYETVLE